LVQAHELVSFRAENSTASEGKQGPEEMAEA
jgi:hypothetical protein